MHIFKTAFTGKNPHLVGVIGPSPLTLSLQSIIFPFLWAAMLIPPPKWQTIKFKSL